MRLIHRLNLLAWYTRLPLKWCIFLCTLLAVCFPYPRALLRHLSHLRNPQRLIDPDAPELTPLADQLAPTLGQDIPPKDKIRRIEQLVLQRVQYAWDWDTWGLADYWPTVSEALQAGREDCDGRAIVAASLMRKLGLHAELVTDFSHLWVRTEFGDAMGPGRTTLVTTTASGPRINWTWRMLTEPLRATGLGIAVFPLAREAILLAVLWILIWGPRASPLDRLLGLRCLVVALVLLRVGGATYAHPIEWMQLVGVAYLFAALVVLHGRDRKTPAAAPNPRSPGESGVSA